MSEQCGNCGVYREIKDGIVEKCPNCGDDEWEFVGVPNPYSPDEERTKEL